MSEMYLSQRLFSLHDMFTDASWAVLLNLSLPTQFSVD